MSVSVVSVSVSSSSGLYPELCVQKENVLSLQLFGTVRREGAK